ncbi:hypothetical protein DFH08DRAFT_1009633 [Mycena albidolilacea]|uniref:Uncharacterized protein n=1 Tax=Mycena albidolilacea TaxID=1033008 RepID=A0AAD6ZWX4_9AGAR|nr:hypothetical protein DFH08DRAFT_1009633 [Mycena albidolilacea]
MPKATTKTPKLAQRSGRWITKTAAMKTYNLGSSDMDAILPVSDVRNPRNYLMRVKAYNIRDVVALARRIRSSSQSLGYAVALESVQIDRIRPVRELPNPHSAGTMRFYNRCDVQVLADSIAAAAAAPTGTSI